MKARPVPYAIRPKVEEELDRLQKAGVIEPIEYSDWATPVVPVLKNDGGVRLCGDYKLTANQATKLFSYPLPRIEDLYATLSGGEKFTSLDLQHAYNQVDLSEESRAVTTINTHRGLYQYKKLPFGVSSAPGIFQRIIDSLVRDIPNVCAYLDDILITGKSDEEHLRTLERVLTRLKLAGFTLKKEKCKFLADSVEYLGFSVDKDGLHTLDHKLRAVREAPAPQNAAELKSYLGMVTHFSRFVNNAATILAPLHRLLHKDQPWRWSQVEQDSFEVIKAALGSTKMLVHYDPEKPLIIKCDASPYGVGAVLLHRMPSGEEKPIAFASRTLTQAEKNYAQLDKEALAIMFGVKRFHLYVFGRHFEILTDHKPLLGLLGEDKGIQPMSSPRMQRWALTLTGYSYTMKFIPGRENTVADALSRLPLAQDRDNGTPTNVQVHLLQSSKSAPINSNNIRMWTSRDPLLSQIKCALQQGWPTKSPATWQPFSVRQNELSLQDGCILWGSRVLVPPQGRKKILEELHEAHPGVSKMKALARSYVWWPGMDKEIEEMVQRCEPCQRVLKSPPKVPLKPWSWPDSPWKRIHVDYFGPFLGQMFFVVVDAHSKWLEVVPTGSSSSSATTISKLRAIFATFGIPEMLVSDNGPAFVSAEFTEFMSNNGIKHLTTAPYHAASNGLAERAVQTAKRGLGKQHGGDLMTKLSRFLFKYRITPHETTGVSPSELMFKRKLRTRLDLLQPSMKGRIVSKQQSMKARYDQHTTPREFSEGDLVYTRLPHESFWIPAQVSATAGQLLDLQLEDGRAVRRHKNFVRRKVDPDPPTAEPLPPNREPAMLETSDPQRVMGFQVSNDETIAPTQQEVEEEVQGEIIEANEVAHELRRSSRVSRPPDRLQMK